MDSPVMNHYLGSLRARAGAIDPDADPAHLDRAIGQARTDLESQARSIQQERPGVPWDDALLAAINARPRALDDAARAVATAAVVPPVPVPGGPSVQPSAVAAPARAPVRWNAWAALGVAVVALVLAVVAVVLASSGNDPLAPEGTDSVPSTGGANDAATPPAEAATYAVDESPTARVGQDVHSLELAQATTLSWSLAPTAGCASLSVLDDDGAVAFERTNVCLAQGASWDLGAGSWRVVYDYSAFTGDVRAWLD